MKRKHISGMLTLLLAFQVNIYGQDRLDGTAAVTATGGASYTVQIQTPKGVGDLKPSISLTYSSQSGNGVAGFGCSITGIPVITRGVKNYLYNETPKGIKYTTSDALYMDGKRLIRKSGTEGTDGSVYSPEGEPFTTITLHGTSTSTASWFEVDTNDGMTYEFGRAAGTQQTTTVSSSQVPYAWYISKGTNTLGQTITYQYQTADRYLYPQTISYGSGNSVAFEYEARTDSIRFVLNGQKGCVGRRLRSITSKAGSNVYRTYTMSYNSTSDASATKFSRLTYITETGTTGNGSRRITLGWNYLRSFSASSSTPNITIPQENNLFYDIEERYFTAGDLNGDGFSDIVQFAPVIEYTALPHSSGNCVPQTYVHVFRSSVTNGSVSYPNSLHYSFGPNIFLDDWCQIRGGMCISDIDGDGINDLILPGGNASGGHIGSNFIYALGKDIERGNTGTDIIAFPYEAATEMPLYGVTDLDNDGKNDIVVLEKQHTNGKYQCYLGNLNNRNNIPHISLTLTGKPRKLFTGDYNGDGMADMLVVCDDGYRIFFNRGGVVSSSTFANSSTLIPQSDVHHRMEQGDFNGDGIPDFVWNDHNSSRIYFSLGNGDGTFTRKLAYTLPYTVRPKNTDSGTWIFLVADLDHDGKSDVVINARDYSAGRTYTHWLMSDGTKLILKRTASSNRESDAKAGHICVGDFKGQGWLEVMNYGYDCWSGSNADVSPSLHLYGSSAQKVSDGKLFSATNSDGRTTSFTYGSMTSDLLYTKGTGGNYPVVDVAAPLCVVSQMKESGASPVTRKTSYTYKGLRAHLRGRGILGFTEQTASEYYTGSTTTARVTDWNTTYYVPRSTSTTTTQGGFTTTSVAASDIVGYGYNYMSLPSSLTETDPYGNVTTTTCDYNTTLGYLTKKRTEFGNSNMYRQTEYTYPAGKIGKAYRPLTVKQTQKHSDSTQPYITTTKYTYNGNGLPTKVIENANTPMALTTDYVYDTHGNVTKETVSGAGITTPRVTNYQYSDGKFLTQQSTTPVSSTIYYGRNPFGEVMALLDLTYAGSSSQPLITNYTYNGFGMVTRETKPSGAVTTYSRTTNSNGYTLSETREGGGTVTRKYDALDNELSSETKGVGGTVIKTTNTYNSRGFLTGMSLMRVAGGATQLRSMSYNFDGATGNLLSRTGMTAQQETFEYDDLDRLVRVRQGNSVAQQMEYADNGNMESKSWIGDFSYNGQQPHAVTSVGNDLGYIPSTTQQATYTAFGKVESLTDGAYSMSFTYGPDEERWKTVLRQNGTVKRTTFYAGDYERVTENGVTRHFYYLDNGCIYVIEGSQSTGTYYYAFTDHLGSITHIFNESGGTVFKAEYDAWGRQAVSKNTIGFHRGYTGHEMLPEFGLINMNGRLYDPMLGRFLSPDNFVQMPDFSQSFNRYSYCINNPLKYNDPDGEWFGIDDLIASVIGGAVNLGMNLLSGDVHSFGQGLSLFFAGAAAGELSLYGQPELAAVVIGAGNSLINQSFNNGSVDWMQVATAGGMSLLTYGISEKLSPIFEKPISSLTSKITNSIVKKALQNGLINSATGFSLGLGFGLARGDSFSESMQDGLSGAATGFATGAITGAAKGIMESRHILQSELEGTANQPEPERIVNEMLQSHKMPISDGDCNNSVYVGVDKDGTIRYVGITGRKPETRWNEHYNSGTEKANLRYRTIQNATGLSRIQARIIEQRLINVYGMQKYNGALYNKINSIRPRYWNKYGIINK